MGKFSFKVGRVKAELDPALEARVREIYDVAYREILAQLEEIGESISTTARLNWYNAVDRRTGETGQVDYEMVATPSRVATVVHPGKTDRSYYVRRPGPNSTLTVGTDEFTYARIMSVYRRTGEIPLEFRRVAKFTPNGRPTGLFQTLPNPKASDGGSQWKTWVLDPGKKLAQRLKVDGSEVLTTAVANKLRRVG